MTYVKVWSWWCIAWLPFWLFIQIRDSGWMGILEAFIIWGVFYGVLTFFIGPDKKQWQAHHAEQNRDFNAPVAFEDEGIPSRPGHRDPTRPDTDDYMGMATAAYYSGHFHPDA